MSELKNFETAEQKHQFLIFLKKFGRDFLFVGLMAFCGMWWFGILESSNKNFECGAEKVVKKNKQDFFYKDGNYFAAGKAQSDDFAFEGKYSLKLDSKTPFGFNYNYEYLKGNEEVIIWAWRYAEGDWKAGGKIVANINGKFWKAEDKVVATNEAGWEKIQFSFFVPNFSKNEILSIYCWNPGSQPVYFDDLHIILKEKIDL